MTTTPLAFQPTPRPQPRTTPEDTARLQAATEDLGFGRAMPKPLAPRTVSAERKVEPRAAASRAKVSERAAPKTQHGAALKLAVPDEVWDELRFEAVKRRVTVRFLVLEALAAKGYNVDLAATPEDGRRIR